MDVILSILFLILLGLFAGITSIFVKYKDAIWEHIDFKK